MNTILIVIISIVLWEAVKLTCALQRDPCAQCDLGEYVHINDLVYCDTCGHMKRYDTFGDES